MLLSLYISVIIPWVTDQVRFCFFGINKVVQLQINRKKRVNTSGLDQSCTKRESGSHRMGYKS